MFRIETEIETGTPEIGIGTAVEIVTTRTVTVTVGTKTVMTTTTDHLSVTRRIVRARSHLTLLPGTNPNLLTVRLSILSRY